MNERYYGACLHDTGIGFRPWGGGGGGGEELPWERVGDAPRLVYVGKLRITVSLRVFRMARH